MAKSLAFRIRVKPEGERAFTTSLRAFLRDNRGAFPVSVAKRLRRLRPGAEECFGGGAADAFCVTRPGTKSRFGSYWRR